ncbi:MAG: hypothetical protein K2X06_09705 [Burkholderiales bacterium]|nr:hypothetical protein [Burkholderiales bacterium]
MKIQSKLTGFINQQFFLHLNVFVFLFSCALTNATAASNVGLDKNQVPSNLKISATDKSLCKSIIDSQGKKYTHAKMGGITYKIPYEYIGGGTCNSGSVFLGIRWPSLTGFKTIIPGSGDIDAYRVILMPPTTPPVVDRYVSLNRILKFDMQKIPSKYPGLSFLQINGKQWSILVSGEQWPKTPSGNPYAFRVSPL